MGPSRIALVALALTACQQVLGLDRPEIAIDAFADDDRDGIGNDTDNCLAYANPDQLDTDRDGIGDACQGCIALALRASDDDDKDDINDTVDSCMSDPGAPGSDTDGDGIPDQCDLRSGGDVRFCVMTFRDAASDEDPKLWMDTWTLGNWTISGSALNFARPAAGQPTFPTNATFSSPGGIAFESRITLNGYTAPMISGIQARGVSGPPLIYECRVTSNATTSYLQILKNGSNLQSFSLSLPAPMQLTSTLRMAFDIENGLLQISCRIDPDSLPRATINASDMQPLVPLQPGFYVDNADVAVHDLVIYELGE